MLSQWAFSSFLVKSLGETINNYFLKSNLIVDLEVLKVELNYSKSVITYQSLICLFLSKKYKININNLTKDIADIYNKKYENITVFVSGDNWLEFQINASILTNWLSQLLLISWQDFPESKNNYNQNNLGFNDYYIAARFASILRSAHQQKLIYINILDLSLNNFEVKSIKQILANQVFSVGSYEYNLIKDLLLITEKIYQSKSKINYSKFLTKLRENMAQFERYCRIWGEVKEENFSLSQARLGLMAIALNYYQNLFYRQFGQKLPTEL